MAELVFLGTSAMVPTKERNHSSIFLRYNSYGILFDCGEGTQRQLKIAKIKPSAINVIFISHWDGDHVLGLPGLIQTLAMSEENKKLRIIGPKGTKAKCGFMLKAFEFQKEIELKISELEDKEEIKKCYEAPGFLINAYKLEHKVVCYGYEFIEKDMRKIELKKVREAGIPEGPLLGKIQEGKSIKFKGKLYSADDLSYIKKGKKAGFISDTRICNNCIKLAKDKDVVVCDSTFHSMHEEKAEEYYHMTAKQAASVAQQACAKKLVLTHFSQRYSSVAELEEEAKAIFPNTIAAYDFMKLKI